MLKIENVEVLGWEAAIRGMRNPMNSWEKSDSCYGRGPIHVGMTGEFIEIGPNDHQLMMSLAKGGAVHAKYRRMITVYMDITAPLYWWKEMDTYRVGVEKNSCSTMHKIHAKGFTLDDFSCEHLTPIGRDVMLHTINILNTYRRHFVNWDKIDDNSKNAVLIHEKKDAWWQMIQLLPSSYNQKRTIMLNYEVLSHIYKDRRNHKLDEWHVLCDCIEGLPYSELITMKESKE